MPLCLFTKAHFYDHNGKCACGRRATQDENLKEKKMTQDIRVGDKIYATPKDGDVTVSGTVFGVAAGNKTPGSVVVNLGGITIDTANWDISVTERPFQLPTEPGLYIRKGVSTLNENYGVYRLTDVGEWLILSAYNNTQEPAAVKRNLEVNKVKLVRLVVGEVAS